MALVVAALALSACGNGGTAQSVHLSGQLEFPSNSSLPEHANAEISLVQLATQARDSTTVMQVSDNKQHIVAEQTLHDVQAMPVKFDVEINNALLAPDKRYVLTARVVNQDGQLLWQSERPRLIKPHEAPGRIDLTLAPTAWNDTALSYARLVCHDGFAFRRARFAGHVALRVGDRGLELPAEASQDGLRYAADDVWFQARADGATLHIDGTTHTACVARAS